jgi:hypothetical protein
LARSKKFGNNQEKSDNIHQNKVLEILTSFTRGVEELPKISVCSSPAPTLSLFGEGARGLGGGVDVSTICWRGGEESAVMRISSDRTTVLDVLVGAAPVTASSSSSFSFSPLTTYEYEYDM